MDKQEGVLLYYKFAAIDDSESLKQWFLSLCTELSLVGRIRIASDGVNVTIGGSMDSLHKHIAAVESNHLLGKCDFKLASAHSPFTTKSSIASEVGFDSLCIRVVKELVTLGLHPSKCPSIQDSGLHLFAEEFHSKIQEAEKNCSLVLRDETKGNRLNYYLSTNENGESVTNDILLPHNSHYDFQNSTEDLVSGAAQDISRESNLVLLDVRNIYETRIGRFVPPKGVKLLDPKIRQYSDLPHWIDSNSEKLQDKHILMYCTGGVRCEMASAYIKNKGKGFQNVFQLSGGIQRYLETFPDGGFFKGKNFVFDYRLAVPSFCSEVIGSCMKCGVAFDDYSSRVRCSSCRMLVLICNKCQASMLDGPLYRCELCEINHRKNDASNCDFDLKISTKMEKSLPQEISIKRTESRKLRILCLHGFRQSASSLKGRLASFTKKLKTIAEFIFIDAPHEVPMAVRVAPLMEIGKNGVQEIPHQKYAWLVTPDMMPSSRSASCEDGIEQSQLTTQTTESFDRNQYKKQIRGWEASLNKLQQVFHESGPFDGILGFSQGAAVAFALCLLKKSLECTDNIFEFQFVILCSGFISSAPEHQKLMLNSRLPLKCPSLHVFGEQEGCDRQINMHESMVLSSMFQPENCLVLKHKSGHIVPGQKEYVDKVKSFLARFLS